MHGYDLITEYDRQEVVDWASVSKAQVYYALRKLEKAKLIKGRVEAGQSRDRIIYETTAQGHVKLKMNLVHENWARARVAQPFATWLGLSIHLDEVARRKILCARQVFLFAEIGRERESLVYIKTLPSKRAQAGVEIVSLVIKQLEAEVLWLADLLDSTNHH